MRGRSESGDASRRPSLDAMKTTPTSAAACSRRTGTTSGSAASEHERDARACPTGRPIATFNFGGNPSPDTLTATIDEVTNPKGMSFATWMLERRRLDDARPDPDHRRRATRARASTRRRPSAGSTRSSDREPPARTMSRRTSSSRRRTRSPPTSAAARSCSPTCTCRRTRRRRPARRIPNGCSTAAADAAGEGAGVHVLRHRVVRRLDLLGVGFRRHGASSCETVGGG